MNAINRRVACLLALVLIGPAAGAGSLRNFGSTGGTTTGGSDGSGTDPRALIVVSETRSMALGRLVGENPSGTLSLSPGGVVTENGVRALDIPLSGELSLTGEPGENYTLTVTTDVGSLTANGVTVGTLTVTPTTTTGQFDGTGNATVQLGAQLVLTGTTNGIEASGSYTVEVTYSN
jgi:hypothetical protein